MVPSLLFDLSGVDLDKVVCDVEGIERVNPHRGDMRLLDGIIHVDESGDRIVAFKDVGADEFWVPGHIPGRPVFPGVLMLEAAAQLCSFMTLRRLETEQFLGFVGAEDVKFRGQVVPGNRLILLCMLKELRRRRCVCRTQGLVNGTLVFEATIIGMPI